MAGHVFTGFMAQQAIVKEWRVRDNDVVFMPETVSAGIAPDDSDPVIPWRGILIFYCLGYGIFIQLNGINGNITASLCQHKAEEPCARTNIQYAAYLR